MIKEYFADLHIHVGVSERGNWVKIPTSKHLTIRGILNHTAGQKGIDVVGIADALSPEVLTDLNKMLAEGLLKADAEGGYHYQNPNRDEKDITLILGAEIETSEEDGGLAHTLLYLPDIRTMTAFSKEMSKYIKNISLSSQNAHMPLKKLIKLAKPFEPLIIPAHIFTPHKSIYGACARRLSAILPAKALTLINAVELGLSADSYMADRLEELAAYSFVTNSDAHSLDKIGREYNVFSLVAANFEEISMALSRQKGRMVKANFGLDPRLGKYHRTLCASCSRMVTEKFDGKSCPFCQSRQIIKGVLDRVDEIADWSLARRPEHRPEYFYQIPLEFIAGLGKKTMSKLLARFGTEMNILHAVGYSELAETVGAKIAGEIIKARNGKAEVLAGGGGVYGKVI